jgi:hypothetical protein
MDDIKIGSPATCSSYTTRAAGETGRTGSAEMPFATAPAELATKAKNPEAMVDEKAPFAVTVFPNPTTAEFELRLTSKATETATVRVFDMLGRVVKQMRMSPNQSVRFGIDLKNGSYIAEILQGNRKEVVKLIKL